MSSSPPLGALLVGLLSFAVLVSLSGFMLQFACYALGLPMPRWRRAVLVTLVASFCSHVAAAVVAAVPLLGFGFVHSMAGVGALYGFVALVTGGAVCGAMLKAGFVRGVVISVISRFLSATAIGAAAAFWLLFV